MDQNRIEQLFKFLESNPRDSFVKFALALEYIKDGDEGKALQYFSEIRNDDPEYTGVYYHLGKLYERRNQRDLAEETYKDGIRRTVGNDRKSHQELQEALNQLLYDEE